MPNYKLPSGQIISDQDPNLQEFISQGAILDTSTQDNLITNNLVNTGVLPENQREIFPQTGDQLPVGATQIFDPAELSGLTEEQIFRDPASDKIFRLPQTQQATLTSPTGEKRVVDVGSQEASQLLQANWTLGDKIGGGTLDTVTGESLTPQDDIELGDEQFGDNGAGADAATASFEVDIKATEEQIKRNLELLQPPESDLSARDEELIGGAETAAEELTGRGAAQLEQEEARGIEAQNQVIADKNIDLKKKVAEIQALTTSFELENTRIEGLNILQTGITGKKAQNFRMYLAQKNALTSEAGFIQAELLGLQGKVAQAQAAADRAVDLEYQDRTDAYNAKINQLNILLPQLEGEEERYAEAVKLTLENQATALAEAKTLKANIQNIKLQAITSGITDASVLSQIGNATTVNEALQILGTSMPTDLDANTQIVSVGNRQLLINKQTGETIKDLGAVSYKPTGGGVGTGDYPKGFWSAISKAVDDLQRGEQWGTVFDRVKLQFPTVANEDIDIALGTQWREPGAFEEFKGKQYKPTQPRQFELESGVWAWLATEEAQSMDNEQLKQEIMGAGFNPEDFGIY